MNRALSHRLSIIAGLAFASWIVWLWVAPDQKVVEQAKPTNAQAEEVELAKVEDQPDQSQPQTLVLPAPPKPAAKVFENKVVAAPVVEPAPDPIVEEAPKPIVEEKPAPAPTPKPEPVAKAKPTPKPTPKPVPKPIEKIHEASPAEVVGGRALLRVLEHGKGPLIEIAWPQQSVLRDGLHKTFQSCFGMENALMDRSGDLYRLSEARGQRWEINLDRFSGFLRQASGRLPASEQRIEKAVLRHHRTLSDPVMVRIFPRRVDASLLGGLKAVVGEGYMQAKSIQARYEQEGTRILVRDIRLDGHALDGVVELSKVMRCSGRV